MGRMNDEAIWQTGYPLDLKADEVHVWRVGLERPLIPFLPFLSPDEIERANRFRFERDYRKYVVARGVLRQILSRYVAVPPQNHTFNYSSHSKPFLADSPLAFNVSHSGEMALMAFTLERQIGVDVEALRPLPDAAQIAVHYFSKQEIAAFNTVPPSEIENAFFTIWTRKEAFIKALGEGLSHPLDSFDVTFLPQEPPQISRQGLVLPGWCLRPLHPGPGYVAALVLDQTDWQLTCWHWQ